MCPLGQTPPMTRAPGLVTIPDNRPPLKSKAAGRSQVFNVFRGADKGGGAIEWMNEYVYLYSAS